MVQGLGLSMVVLVGLSILPWTVVLAWTAAAVGAIAVEHRLLHLIRAGGASRRVVLAAPVLRTVSTSIYALAAGALFLKGGLGQQLFAFALISASMVHVLMRHYRSPLIMLLSLSPYIAVLTVVGVGLAAMELEQGHLLSALAPAFMIAMIGVQFWSARAQLAGAWTELTGAHQATMEREHAAQAANRAKSQFLATMSHELRTPLNGVLGMAQALAHEPITPGQRERVKIIRRSGETLLAVLNDLLDLSKVEAGELELETVEFDLDHLVRGVAAVYHPMADKKGFDFDCQVDPAASGRYLGDSARVRRILYGLCDNAVKFTDTGEVSLRVSRTADAIVFEVADTGIGIADDELAHLFEGFYQVDASATRRHGGMGVGLAICSRLTALMRGSIEAASTRGQGSAFTLSLPLERVETPALASEASAKEAPIAELRVLAAEDNVTNQMVLKMLLAPAGIVPTLVENGREALDAWESQTWDIVLMDIQMPEMGGVEATRLIRRREAETGRARTPILAVTANAMTHQVGEYDAAGMDGVVAKPFDIGKLFKTIDTVLAARAESQPSALRA